MKPLALLVAIAAAAMAQPTATRPSAPQPGPSYKDLKFPPLMAIEIPKIEKATLPNGMRIYLLEDHELPMVHGAALVRTGNLFDPPDKVGLAELTGQVLRTGGTKSKTGEEIDVQLENMAAHVEAQIGETSGSVGFSALKENAAETMAVFHDVLTAPEFRQEKLDLAKSLARSAISRRNDAPQSILGREFASAIYGRDNPYGWQDSYSTVAAITRADLQAFYTRYFFPKNVMLAVWGDFDSARMKADLEKLFADWTVEQAAVPPFPKVTAKDAGGAYLAVKTGIGQTFFALGHLSGELRDKDYPALETMADILGGGFHSRLMQTIRTKMGSAYDISATWGAAYDHPGMFEISGSTNTPSTVETIDAVLKEVDRIRTAPVTEDELKTAKDTALNSLVFAFDTKTKSLNRALTYEYYGYPADFIAQYRKALTAVTAADILRVAKQYLDPAKLAIVAVGNPVGFAQPLEKLGRKVTTLDIAIPGAARASAASDAASLERGKRLLEAAQQAVGGREALEAVKDFVESATLDAASANIHVKQTLRWVAPNHWREETELPVAKAQFYTDGKSGWMAMGTNAQPLAGPQARQANGDLFRSYVSLLLSSQIEGRTVNAVDANTVEIGDKNGYVARLTLDAATHLPKSLSYDAVSMAGPAPAIVESYGDFREVAVNGGAAQAGRPAPLKVPFQTKMTQNGSPYANVTVTDFRINTGLKLEDIQKRP